MPLSYLPAFLTSAFADLAHWLHKRSAARLPLLLAGILFARGRRTVTSWSRAAGITTDFRNGYTTACAVGRRSDSLAITAIHAVKPLLDSKRLVVAVDDMPTKRYGPRVEGAGIHRHPSPGPAGEEHPYGHVWVVLAALARHRQWGSIALPLQGQLYVREADVAKLPPERRRPFRTKLGLAAEQLDWLKPWVGRHFEERWAVADGGYSKKPFLRPAKQEGWVVVGRLRKDAALRDLPPAVRPPGRRGPLPTYGKGRICLAGRAADPRGWQAVECVQYGEEVIKTVKTFLATWRPAGGVIRVVLVKEEGGWLPFFCTKAGATAAEVLEAMADRNALEQTNKDVKEVWGAGEQQVRNLHSNIGCLNPDLWLYSLVEAWAWARPEEELVDRGGSPWDSEPRRPSHADKRRALQREILGAEIEAALCGRPTKEGMRALAQRLLRLAA
jgi:DDE superfamily endonuclease